MKFFIEDKFLKDFKDNKLFEGKIDVFFADGKVYKGAILEGNYIEIPYMFYHRVVKVSPIMKESLESKIKLVIKDK